MPNWVRNIVCFDCEEQKFNEICKKIINKKGEFDFNKIIKMPPSIATSDTGIFYGIDDCQAVIYYLTVDKQDERAKYIAEKYYLIKFPESDSFLNFQNAILQTVEKKDQKEKDKIFKRGKILCKNINRYGVSDWYTWAIKNWGTKWNATNTEVDKENQGISFWTPWNAPELVFFGLSEMFPDITIVIQYADEDVGGGNNGVIVFKEGKIIDEECDMGTKFANEVWGYEDEDEILEVPFN